MVFIALGGEAGGSAQGLDGGVAQLGSPLRVLQTVIDSCGVSQNALC